MKNIAQKEGKKQPKIKTEMNGKGLTEGFHYITAITKPQIEALQIKLPEALPSRNIQVVTRKKLPDQRKSQ